MDQSQLSNLENLCKVLYESSNTSERNHAQQAILVLQSSSDYITQCQYILDHSKCSYALLVGSNSLSKLISTYWNNFDSPQRVQIRNYVLNYLANNGPGLEKYVSVAIIQLLCKITKLGWFDGSTHREITGEVSKFLSATVEHCVIGLQILNELVTQMNTPLGDQTLTVHRKIAVSFREQSLFRAMEIAFSTLSTIHLHQMAGASVETENSIAELSLQLAIKCLSFDFIGTNPDESAEEMGALQVPSAWRPLIQDPATMTLLFDVYGAMPPAIGARTLESLMLLACVRRSLFSPDKERTRFLGQLIKGITIILSNQTGLADHQNYHEFCRLLGRLKSNYQLTELIYTDGYKEWMDLVADFTVKSLQQWQWSANSVTYLLSLWARMVAAVPYVRADPSGKNGPMLDVYIPQVIRAYIHSRIEAVEQCSIDESMENLLDDIGNVMEQLDKLPIICHFQYRSLGDFMLSIFDPLISQYAEAIEAAGRNSMSSNNISPQCQVAMVEKKLAWLIYIVGAVLGGHSTTTAQGDDGDELVDGDLSQRVFRVMQMAENRLIESGGNLMSDMHLELSLLHYFHNFRRTYIGEQHGMPSTTSSPPLNTKSLSAKHQAYLRMFERLGHGSHTLVVNQIITKVGNNLKFWGNSGEVIEKTLDLFMEIASGYSSGKLLLGLETVHYLLGNHTDEEFPFLAIPANTRHRTTFHAILARLLFTAFDDASERHENFMAPIVSVLSRLMQASSYRQAEVKQAVIGICRDLRGITVSTHNRRTYGSLFELLHPDYFPVFVRAADECFDDPSVINALLKFMYEFSYNKAQRVIFDQSSPSGILLFREISQIIVAYGTKILPIPAGDDPYPKKYKGITLCLGILARALNGNYVNFGVFALYNDAALDNALAIALQLALSIPLSDIMSFVKVKKAYFQFIEVLFRNHMTSVISLETSIFFQLVQSLHEGINSYDMAITTNCAGSIDHLASYYYQHSTKKVTAMGQALNSHLQSQPSTFSSLLSSCFNILLYGEASAQYQLSRPILSLTLCSEDALTNYKQQLLASQPTEHHSRVVDAFTALFTDVLPNLETPNRDKFQQKLGQLRNALRSFLVKA